MLSAYDKWLLPKDAPELPGMDGEDESRILLDILWSSFRQTVPVATIPDHLWREWMDKLIGDGPIFEALTKEHREAIEERWAEEHTNP